VPAASALAYLFVIIFSLIINLLHAGAHCFLLAMTIILQLLIALTIVLAGCSPRATDSEFTSLKQADYALQGWIKSVLTMSETGDPISNGDHLEQIINGPIIKSDLGKKLRTNMQATLALVMAAAEGAEDVFRARKAVEMMIAESDLNRAAGRFDAAKADLDRAQAMNDQRAGPARALAEKLKALPSDLAPLTEEREQMFKEMRETLEN